MNWLRSHPYAAATFVGAIALLAIVIVVMSSAPVPLQTAPIAWSGTGAAPQAPYAPAATPVPAPSTTRAIAPTVSRIESAAPYTYAAPSSAQESGAPAAQVSGTAGYDAFVASLTKSAQPSASSTASAAPGVYSFIPQALISTSTLGATKRTPLQQSLYDYGNAVGGDIQSFEDRHPNEVQVLKDQSADRSSAANDAALAALGNALSSLGVQLQQMDAVPPQAKTAHDSLAAGYQAIGAKLVAVSKTRSDSDFIAAIKAYDAAANSFIRSYVALATLFTAYGVTFEPGDPGGVFSFNSASL